MRRITSHTRPLTTGSSGDTNSPRRSPSSQVSSAMIFWITGSSRKTTGSSLVIFVFDGPDRATGFFHAISVRQTCDEARTRRHIFFLQFLPLWPLRIMDGPVLPKSSPARANLTFASHSIATGGAVFLMLRRHRISRQISSNLTYGTRNLSWLLVQFRPNLTRHRNYPFAATRFPPTYL